MLAENLIALARYNLLYVLTLCTLVIRLVRAKTSSMNIRFIFLLLLTASGQLYSQEDEAALDPLKSWELTQAKWTETNSFDGEFRVITPGDLQEKIDSIETAIGTLVYHTLYFAPTSEKAENEVYMISYVDYPEGTLHPDSTELIQALFDETQEAAVESVRGELMFSQDAFLQTHPSRYWRIDYLNGRGSIRTKAIVADHRFYTIQTVSQRQYGMNTSTDRFIDSFRVFTKKN